MSEREYKTCERIGGTPDAPSLAPGWGCCKCRIYNGDWRPFCKRCEHPYCGPAAKKESTR